jgi:hypothetical protein
VHVRVQYDFLRVGTSVNPRRGHIFLDIGNRRQPGVIDTHAHEYGADDFECSSTLVAARPSLVTDWLSADDLAGVVTLVVHESPDYDCIASSLLVRKLIEARASGKLLPDGWDEWAPLVANSARRVDRGETRLRLPITKGDEPITPSLSVIALHDLAECEPISRKDAWRRVIERGHIIFDRAIALANEKGVADLELTDLRGHLADLGDLETIIDEKISAFARDAVRIGLTEVAPEHRERVDGVFDLRLPLRDHVCATSAAKIASIKDPECRGAFFKSVIRGAYAETVDATCVFSTVKEDRIADQTEWVRAVISVDPASRFDLRGLGAHVDELETTLREEKHIPRLGPPRPGFDNSDPWYDGRAFAYTIVDAPRFGTILTPEQVHGAVIGPKWLARRRTDVGREMLGQLRVTNDAAKQRKAFASIAEVVAFWATTHDREARLFAECVDTLAAYATPADAPAYAPLLEIDEIVLAFLTSDDPAVRVDALAAAGRAARATIAYAALCGRTDIAALVTIAAGPAAEAVARLAVGGTIEARHQLSLDAVAAHAAISGDEPSVFHSAAALAARCADAHVATRSIIHLWSVLRDAAFPAAALLEPIARRIEASAAPPAPPASDAASEFRQSLHTGRYSRAAQKLRAVILANPSDPATTSLASELLEKIAAAAADAETMSACCEMLKALQAASGTAEIVAKLSEKAALQALRIAPDFVGRVLWTIPFDRAARRLVIVAALGGEWQNALEDAHRFVLTPESAEVYRQCVDLTICAAAARKAGAQSVVRRPSDLAFLLLASMDARQEKSDASLLSILSRIASTDDVLSVVDEIGALRGQIDELRQTIPDHVLLGDVEGALAMLNTFARTLSLTMGDETTLGNAVALLLRIAAVLPEIDFDAALELVKLEQSAWPPKEREPDALAATAFACGRAIVSVDGDHALVTDVHRVRAAAATIATAAKSCPDTALGRLTLMALRGVERVLESYGYVLEDRHRSDAETDRLSLRILSASTVGRIARDFRTLLDQSRPLALALTRVVARAESEDRPDAARRTLSRLRRDLGNSPTPDSRYRIAARHAVTSASGVAVDRMYDGIRELLSLPVAALDAAYVQIVDGLIRRYDMRRARHRIDEYSFGCLPRLLRFWMSGWTVVAPIVFLAIFAAPKLIHVPEETIVRGLEIGIAALFGSALGAIAVELLERARNRPRSRTDSLRYKLFLPHYVLLVIFGVYSAAITEEIASHMALQLSARRFTFVAVGLFAGSAWALREVIRRHGGAAVTLRHVVVATGRLFAYAFVIALLLNIVVEPLVKYEVRLHEQRVKWIGEEKLEAKTSLLVDEIDVGKGWLKDRLPTFTLFPRHILLNALFGMFIGIFLRGFWRVGEKE